LARNKAGLSAEQIIQQECERHRGKPKITGYARPIATGDERVAAMEIVTKDLGFTVGDHLSLAYEVQDVLLDKYNESMNINGYVSAFMLDQGYSVEEIYHICAVCVESGVLACYVEANDRPAESFLPLRCDDIEYIGVDARPLPDDYTDSIKS
jgi:citrate synthase